MGRLPALPLPLQFCLPALSVVTLKIKGRILGSILRIDPSFFLLGRPLHWMRLCRSESCRRRSRTRPLSPWGNAGTRLGHRSSACRISHLRGCGGPLGAVYSTGFVLGSIGRRRPAPLSRPADGAVSVHMSPGRGAGAICFVVHSLAPIPKIFYFVSAMIKYGDAGELSI